jgi:acetyltransferase
MGTFFARRSMIRAPDFEDKMDVDGTRVTLRTMRPEDREIEQAFVRHLSRYTRFHSTIKELSPALLDRFTNVAYPHDMALIATVMDNGAELEIGVARYARDEHSTAAEMAIAVADDWQGKGIATRLLQGLRSCAQTAGVNRFHASVLATNKPMYDLARKLGYDLSPRNGNFQTLELGKGIEPSDD